MKLSRSHKVVRDARVIIPGNSNQSVFMCARRQRGDVPHSRACDREAIYVKGQCDRFFESLRFHELFGSLEVGNDYNDTVSLPSSVLIC